MCITTFVSKSMTADILFYININVIIIIIIKYYTLT